MAALVALTALAVLVWLRLPGRHAVGVGAAASAAGPAGTAAPPAPPPVSAYTHPNTALTAFGSLPQLQPGVLARQWSSVDPAGLNNDGAPANILFKTPGGKSVVFSATGPGVVDDIWVAGSLAAMGNIRITLDGAAAPVVDMPAAQFFSGTQAPFLAPLVGNATVSSGGNYSLVPIAFQTSCVIAFTGTTEYWHVGYHRLPAGTAITPFSPSENLSTAAAVWAKAGQDPHQTAGTSVVSGRVALAPGATATLARLGGPGQIEALHLTVPSAAVPPAPTLSRDGMAFSGAATFTLRLNPHNTGVRLVRRLDYALPDQTAAVTVDGSPAGDFSTPGSTSGPYFFRNASLALPASLTAGRSQIQVTVSAVGTFTAFTYWAYSDVGGQSVLTDTLQMTAASEAAHAFNVQHVLWQHSLQAAYVPAALPTSRKILGQVYLEIRFDGATAPAVDAPLGLFFGAGLGAATVRSLMFSVDPATGALAAYWPMPFARQATVTLVNRGSTAVPVVTYAIRTRAAPADAAALAAGSEGYFHATYASASPTTPGQTYGILSVAGAGKLVGVSMALSTPPGMPYGLENLQGNPSIFVDGNPTPAYLGTGTEDFFEGGWYFEYGPFTLPTHGSPAQWVGTSEAAHIAAYRLFLSDAIPFYDGIQAGIQVGPTGNLSADYASVAFWYGLPAAQLAQSDILHPADAASAAAHGWSATGARPTAPVTGEVGGGSGGAITRSGVSAQTSTFTLQLPPDNAGAVLRATLDQCPGHQAAQVYVGGTYVGLWSDPASDCVHIWRDSSFVLPASVTRGHSTLQIRLVAAPGPGAATAQTPLWTAFAYRLLAFAPAA